MTWISDPSLHLMMQKCLKIMNIYYSWFLRFTFQLSSHEKLVASRAFNIQLFTHIQNFLAKEIKECQRKLTVSIFDYLLKKCFNLNRRYFKISNVQGVQDQNFRIQTAITQELCAWDPKLVKPKCVWEIYIFSDKVSFLKKLKKIQSFSKSIFFWIGLSESWTQDL